MNIKLAIVFTLVSLFTLCGSLFAQVIDDSSIQDLQNSNINIAEDRLQVIFADTVSPEFITNEFSKMGLPILSSEFQQFVFKAESPNVSLLEKLQKEIQVDYILSKTANLSSDDTNTLSRMSQNAPPNDTLTTKLIDEIRKSGYFVFALIFLDYSTTEAEKEELLQKYSSMNVTQVSGVYRAAVIELSPEQSDDILHRLESLPYVKTTAYIGSFEE